MKPTTWEMKGLVLDTNKEDILVSVHDLTEPHRPDEMWLIGWEKIPKHNHQLIVPGTRMEITIVNGDLKMSCKLPPIWTKKQAKAARKAARKLSQILLQPRRG